MPPDTDFFWTFVVGVLFLVVFFAGIVRQVLRRNPRGSGLLPDVPDASPAAMPSEAPGLTLPYSSLDPFAPPKPRGDRTGDTSLPVGAESARD